MTTTKMRSNLDRRGAAPRLRSPIGRRAHVVVLTLVVAGCGNPDPAAVGNGGSSLNAVDINAAAIEAQGDIDTYAANSLENQPTPVPTPAQPAANDPPAPGEPGGLPDDRTPVSEAPFTPESAQGAANVVQTYYALIEQGKYRDAWRLWSDGGKASKMTAEAFAASFAKYREYHANIGAPGRVDAGAGQRYVEVPVQIYGTLEEGGRPFNARGSIALHRTADIPGATAEDKVWHISRSDIGPTG